VPSEESREISVYLFPLQPTSLDLREESLDISFLGVFQFHPSPDGTGTALFLMIAHFMLKTDFPFPPMVATFPRLSSSIDFFPPGGTNGFPPPSLFFCCLAISTSHL